MNTKSKDTRVTQPNQISAGVLTSIILAILGISLGHANAANVLSNPGGESGSLAGWTTFNNVALESTNNLYYNGGVAAGASNVLTHSGTYVLKTYGKFDGSDNYNGALQDFAASPGSVWTAQGFALSHAQDLMGGANTAWIEVSFRDNADTVLALYQSTILDATLPPSTWINLAVTNEITPVTATVSTLTAPAGTTKVRYEFVLHQPATFDGGSMYWDDLVLNKVTASNPDITTSPTNTTKVVSQTATFSVVATGTPAPSYTWHHGTTNFVNGGRISGATTAALSIANLALSDAGNYTVTVSNSAGSITTLPVLLTVIDQSQANNALGNPSFETGTFSSWSTFNGTAIQTAANFYFNTSVPIDVYDGTYVSQIYNSGEYNGFFQDVTAAPGSVWTADGFGLTSSADQLSGGNTAWIEVQFRAGANIIALYKGTILDLNTTPSTWYHLQVTNQISTADNTTLLGTVTNMVAPAGTTSIRYQCTLHVSGGGGSALFDKLSLIQSQSATPVTITAAASGANLNLSFPTANGSTYQVLYKTNITDSTWSVLTNFPGNGATQMVSTPLSGAHRFFEVSTQ